MSQPLTLPLWGCHLPTGQGLCEPDLLQSASCSECCGKDPTLFCPALVGQNAATDEGSALGPEQWRRPNFSGDHGGCCCAQQKRFRPGLLQRNGNPIEKFAAFTFLHSSLTQGTVQQGSSCRAGYVVQA